MKTSSCNGCDACRIFALAFAMILPTVSSLFDFVLLVPEAGGARWLRGAYIAPDDFASRASQVPPELLREYQSGGRFGDVGDARRRFVKPWEEGNPEIAQVERMIDGVQTVNDTEPIVEDK